MTTVAPDTGHRSYGAFGRLYRGETKFDFVGRRRIWYVISAIIIVAGLVSLTTRGLNLGIDFKGGTSWELTAPHLAVSKVTSAVEAAGVNQPVVEALGSGANTTIQVQADLSSLSSTQQQATVTRVASVLGGLAHTPANNVAISNVGATWGSQITKKAIIAVIVFFIVVVVYISFRFEWKMALAALVAVIHDLLVTAGVYSLFGFQVTPDTVIAVLTILGYSLYDTVVVFDRIRDSTRGLGASGRMTYEDVVNLSMNQVLARSINTSLVAILPVLSVLVIGAQILGATTLQDFGLALVIGLISGAYSSIFIASPILSQLKEREPRYQNIRQKLATRESRVGLLTPAAAAAMVGAGDAKVSRRVPTKRQAAPGTLRPSARAGGSRPLPTAAKRAGAAPVRRQGQPPASAVGVADATELTEANGNGGASQAVPTRSGAPRAAGATPAKRPPPRPRKGKGKGKGGRRR